MANSSSTINSSPAPASQEPDEIDLRAYLQTGADHWLAVVLIVVLTVAVALLATYFWTRLQSPVFTASTDVAIVRSSSDLRFDERFTTEAGQVLPSNFAAQRNALVSLASSAGLSSEVSEALARQFPDEENSPESIAESIEAELVTAPGARVGESDLIRITANAGTPEQAAALATAWAQAYVRRVNQVFGEVPNDLLASVQVEETNAAEKYSTIQAQLENFLAASRVDTLSRQVSDTAAALNTLRKGQQDSLTAVVQAIAESRRKSAGAYADEQMKNLSEPYAAEQQGRRTLALAYINALLDGQTAVFSKQVERDLSLLDTYYSRWIDVVSARDEAVALRSQAGEGQGDLLGSNAMVLSVLRLQAFTNLLEQSRPQNLNVDASSEAQISAQPPTDNSISPSPGVVQTSQPVQVQVAQPALQVQIADTGSVPRPIFLDELDTLITALTDRKTELEQSISTLSASMLSGDGYQFLGDRVPSDSPLAGAAAAQVSSLLTGTLSSAQDINLSRPSYDPTVFAALVSLPELQSIGESLSITNPVRATVEKFETIERAFKSELEAQRAEQARLEQERDIAFETLGTIRSKVAELSVARAAANTLVRQVTEDSSPATQVVTRWKTPAIALSFVFGVFLAIVYVAWKLLRVASNGGKRSSAAMNGSSQPAATPRPQT
jgi:capsular polysaccharide biosynthesis protein